MVLDEFRVVTAIGCKGVGGAFEALADEATDVCIVFSGSHLAITEQLTKGEETASRHGRAPGARRGARGADGGVPPAPGPSGRQAVGVANANAVTTGLRVLDGRELVVRKGRMWDVGDPCLGRWLVRGQLVR